MPFYSVGRCRRFALTVKIRTTDRIVEAVHKIPRNFNIAAFLDKRRMGQYSALCLALPQAIQTRKFALCGITTG